jgi:pimeloyl-ACP methyl ester carboxylesterase
MAAYDAAMELWTVPYEATDLRSRFGTTHLVACGPDEAPPLVLLHCFFTSLSVWAHNVADLSQDHRVYALDMMGQPGRSIPDQPLRTRDDMADWLTDSLDQLEIGKTDVAGYSYGGFAALNFAIHAPQRLGKLVLLSPVGGLVRLCRQFYLRGMVSAALPGLSKLTAKELWFKWFFYQPNLENAATRELYERVLRQFSLGLRYFRMGPMVPPLTYDDEELRSVGSPTLLLIGQHERLYDPVAAIRRATRLIQDIKAELVPHASHDLPISLPETVNQRIRRFLNDGLEQ